MRVPFLLRRAGVCTPNCTPSAGSQATRHPRFPVAETTMAGLKLRGSIWYLTYYANRQKRVVSLETESLQLAKEKKRQFESAQARGDGSSLPTRTPIADVLSGYVQHVRATKTAKS